jgi:hypothetical protein
MKRREKIFWLIIGAIFFVGFIALIPTHGEICKESAKSGEETCASYRLVPFLIIEIGKILDALGVAITALATIAIAWFTWSLRRSTDKLWDAGERQLQLLSETSASQSRDMQASINETRRIGEAQIRAYVDIRDAAVILIGMPGILNSQQRQDVQPIVRITAKNTGQSPARNFVWNPTVQYFSISNLGHETKSKIGELGGNWRELLGAGISVVTNL